MGRAYGSLYLYHLYTNELKFIVTKWIEATLLAGMTPRIIATAAVRSDFENIAE